MNRIKIITTSPSIDINNNVSGIANLTRLWVENNQKVEYVLFTAGKKDGERKRLKWLIKQPFILIKFLITVLQNRDVKIVHINMPLAPIAIVRDSMFVFISYILNKKIVLHFRGGGFNLCSDIPKFYLFLLKMSIKLAKVVFVLGKQEYDFWLSHYNLIANKFVILPNCVEIQTEQNARTIEGDTLKILYLGRIDRNKGLLEIVESLSQVSNIDFKLFIAGSGPDNEWLRALCNRHLPGLVEFVGVVHGITKRQLLKKCNVFLLPSYFEGLPNSLLEAMSYGLVPIITPVGSIPNVVKDKENGLIIKVKSLTDIKDAITTLTKNPLLFNEMSINAIKTIEKDYSVSKHLLMVNSIYSKLR